MPGSRSRVVMASAAQGYARDTAVRVAVAPPTRRAHRADPAARRANAAALCYHRRHDAPPAAVMPNRRALAVVMAAIAARRRTAVTGTRRAGAPRTLRMPAAEPADAGAVRRRSRSRRTAASPDGRRIRIFVAVLPANTLAPKPDPLFILAGGPGQAAIARSAPFASRLTEVRAHRDIVLIDQRGTGRSSPLDCAGIQAARQTTRSTSIRVPRATACARRNSRAQGVDAAQYTTTAWIADLEAMRAALGYATLNLWGGSYGTRVALEYLRRHPDRVRSVDARRRRPAVDDASRSTSGARAQAALRGGASTHAPSHPPCVPRTRIPRAARSRRLPRHWDRTGATSTSSIRAPASRAPHITFDVVLGALQPLTLRAGIVEPAARDAGARGRRRLRPAARGDAARRTPTLPNS